MHRPQPEDAIGVFDSGLGGLTVAAALARALPGERLVYLGDTARVPYGTRSPATIVRYAQHNVGFLHQFGVKLLVVACNTVSAHAMDALAEGKLTPLLGTIRPGARAALAASRGGAIAVLGTPSTIRSEAYVHAVHALDPKRTVHGVACPLLVPLVEEGWLAHSVTTAVIREYLTPLAGTGVDTVILGCTHYPLLRAPLRAVIDDLLGPEVAMVDSASAVASEVKQLLTALDLSAVGPGEPHRFYVTEAPDHTQGIAARFWGGEVGESLALQHVDLLMDTP
ncbi:MAG: glutamate racemase [Myxococcales bacterium]|nr:glutamate racemase [Myxococcales bacterium]